MAFLWGASPAQTEFDTLLEKTTSDLLPSSDPVDLAQSLQMADLIRSAAVTPLQSLKSLSKRLSHDNPNVQLLTLAVLDVCIKNGGTPFLLHLSNSTEFVSTFESLSTSSKGNRDVKEKSLAKLQEWAVAFKGKDQLRDTSFVKLYDRLKNSGTVDFPAKDPTATAAMVDSLSAPEWQDSSYCTRCRTEFSTFNRKHHCRNCGQVFDQSCSSGTAPLPHYGITELVRVCDGCLKKIKDGKGAEVARNQSVKSDQSSSSRSGGGGGGGGGGHERSKSRKEREDEDLRKAIEASLKESSTSNEHGPLRNNNPPPPVQSSGYNPSYANHFGNDSKKTMTNGGGGGEEEDADLAAAIAASLRDIAPPPTAPTFSRQDSITSNPPEHLTYSNLFPSSQQYSRHHNDTTTTPTPRNRINLPSYDLTPQDRSTLDQFSQTFSHHHQPPHYISPLHRQQYQTIISGVGGGGGGSLEGKLERSLQDSQRRKEILQELEWKLGEAARWYGAGLTETAAAYHSPRLYQPQQPLYSQQQQQSQPHHYIPQDPRYQYVPTSTIMGQPLPYQVNVPVPSQPQQPQQEYIPQAQQEYQQQAQQQRYEAPQSQPEQQPPRQQQPQQQLEQPVGFYKPSQFPSVPDSKIPAVLPNVPRDEPWQHQQQREQQREEEEEKVGELIEF